MKKKGFTLIELLIVIGILAILSVAVILTLNPAELLKQARDSTRISDLATLKSALALYLADVASPDMGNNVNCYTHVSGLAAQCGGRFSNGSTTIITSGAVDGSGWIPVKLSNISGGSPISAYPRDPTGDVTYFYAYRPGPAASSTYEMNANMESQKFQQGGPADVESNTKDGGNADAYFEVGTSAGLAL